MPKKRKVEEENDEGMSLDDAFGDDDDDVEYAKPKVKKKAKKKEKVKKISSNNDDLNMDRGEHVEVKGKNVEKLKKGDKIKIDGVEMEIDAHYVMIDHGSTKEMAIECFDPKKDEDFQIRYFNDNVENSMEFYKLDEIIYNKMDVGKIEW